MDLVWSIQSRNFKVSHAHWNGFPRKPIAKCNELRLNASSLSRTVLLSWDSRLSDKSRNCRLCMCEISNSKNRSEFLLRFRYCNSPRFSNIDRWSVFISFEDKSKVFKCVKFLKVSSSSVQHFVPNRFSERKSFSICNPRLWRNQMLPRMKPCRCERNRL